MKLSASVPDVLWGKAAEPDDSPEVVQLALAELVRRRHPSPPYAYTPSDEVVRSSRNELDRAVHRLLDERKRVREQGCRAGLEPAGEDILDTLMVPI